MERFTNRELLLLEDLVALESEASIDNLCDAISRSKLSLCAENIPSVGQLADMACRVKMLRQLENKICQTRRGVDTSAREQ
jgi:hypothetical protein